MPFPNEHACRLRDPDDFEDGSFRRISRESGGKRYDVIMARLKGEEALTEQAYRYPRETWSVSQARQHCRDHDGQEFTPATGEDAAQMHIEARSDEEFDQGIDSSVAAGLIATVNFAGSPRNKYGTHASKGFKGNYAAAWRCHFSQVGGGKTDGQSTGPIRGTVRRVEMIAAGMKPPCDLPSTDSIPARSGPKSPLECSFPSKPGDYGLSSWADPADDDLTQEDIRLTCRDLAIIKRAALAEVKRRAKDREEEEGGRSRRGVEHRAFPAREIRVVQDDGRRKIIGYAALFNVLSPPLWGFRERIQPGAFSKTIREADVRALWNHDSNLVLGRTKNGTLRLKEDDVGLGIEIDPPDTQWARDAMVSIDRGDVDQMSFSFEAVRDAWATESGQTVRTLEEVKLFDVSPVTFPAYPQTSVQLRSILGVEFGELASALNRLAAGSMTEADRRLLEDFIGQIEGRLTAAPAEGGHPAESDADRDQVRARLARMRRELELAEIE